MLKVQSFSNYRFYKCCLKKLHKNEITCLIIETITTKLSGNIVVIGETGGSGSESYIKEIIIFL